jgi:hypothetical protein
MREEGYGHRIRGGLAPREARSRPVDRVEYSARRPCSSRLWAWTTSIISDLVRSPSSLASRERSEVRVRICGEVPTQHAASNPNLSARFRTFSLSAGMPSPPSAGPAPARTQTLLACWRSSLQSCFSSPRPVVLLLASTIVRCRSHGGSLASAHRGSCSSRAKALRSGRPPRPQLLRLRRLRLDTFERTG